MKSIKRHETRIKKMLDSRGIWHTTLGKTGRAVIIACHRGCFVSLAPLVGANDMVPFQQENLDAAQKNGGWGLSLRPDRLHGDEGLEGLLDVIDMMADRGEAKAKETYSEVRKDLKTAGEEGAETIDVQVL